MRVRKEKKGEKVFECDACWRYSVSSFTSSPWEATPGPFTLKEVNLNPFPAEGGLWSGLHRKEPGRSPFPKDLPLD